MGWQVVDRMTIYHESGMYALSPTVTRTPSGSLLVTFQRATHLGYSHHEHPLFNVQACRSEDEGQTWSGPHLVTVDPRGGVMDRGVHTLPDGSIFLHSSCTELIPAEDAAEHGGSWVVRHGKPFWVRSRDEGYTWSAPTRFPPLPDAVWGHPAQHSGVSRSGLLALPDGRLLMPSKATDLTTGEFRYFGMLRVSKDMGETWEYGGRIAEDSVAHFREPTIHRTPSSRILVLFRCHPGRLGPDIVRDQGFEGPFIDDPQFVGRLLVLVYSDDDGETWSPWRPTTVHGSPGHMLGLRDGRIFLTVGTRWEGQRGCVGRVLDPEGSNLDTAPEFMIEGNGLSADCGYPWSVELNDGRVLVVYWHHYPDNHRGIEGAILEEV